MTSYRARPSAPLPETTLPWPAPAPPRIRPLTPAAESPPWLFPRAVLPSAVVPILFPWTTVPGTSLLGPAVTVTPLPLFPEITLPRTCTPVTVPVTAVTDTPVAPLARAVVPAAMVPM